MTRRRLRGRPGLVARYTAGAIAAFVLTGLVVTYPYGLFLLMILFPFSVLVLAALVVALAASATGDEGKLWATAVLSALLGMIPLLFVPLARLWSFDDGVPALIVTVLDGGAAIIAVAIVVGRCRADIEEVQAEPCFAWKRQQPGRGSEAGPQDAVESRRRDR